MPLESVVLGQIDYYGELATAIREIYEDCWRFVVVTTTNRFVLMIY
jgi:hypothetical protein